MWCRCRRTYPPETREKLVARINGLFDGKLAPESFVLSQAYFYGSVTTIPTTASRWSTATSSICGTTSMPGSIFKDGSKVGDEGRHGSNGAGPQHKSRKDDDPEPVDPDKIEAALNVISSDCPYEVWLKIAAALHYALGEAGFELFDRWSAKAKGRPTARQIHPRKKPGALARCAHDAGNHHRHSLPLCR